MGEELKSALKIGPEAYQRQASERIAQYIRDGNFPSHLWGKILRGAVESLSKDLDGEMEAIQADANRRKSKLSDIKTLLLS